MDDHAEWICVCCMQIDPVSISSVETGPLFSSWRYCAVLFVRPG
jgi:hypothetical protein